MNIARGAYLGFSAGCTSPLITLFDNLALKEKNLYKLENQSLNRTVEREAKKIAKKQARKEFKRVNKVLVPAVDLELPRLKQLENQVKQLQSVNKAEKSKMNQYQGIVGAVRGFKNKKVVAEASDRVPFVNSPMPGFQGEFSCTGKSDYLKSLLIPEDGPCSIPDQVQRLHSIRSETVTYNLNMNNNIEGSAVGSPSNVSGVLFLYPNHPTSLVGYNYIQNAPITVDSTLNPPNVYQCTDRLITAQDLKLSYDYGRRTSQLLTIKSSTLPSGMYAINGTFNAVRVDGTLSEMDLDPTGDGTGQNLYASVLADTTNVFDKIGNVSVGDGLSVLAIPDSFVIPYSRLSDTSPAVGTKGEITTQNEIVDSSEDLVYHQRYNVPTFDVTVSNPVSSYTFNVDSTQGILYDFNLAWSFVAGTITAQRIQVALNFLDPFGNFINSIFVESNSFPTVPASPIFNYSASGYFDGSNFTGSPPGSLGPIAAVNVQVNVSNGSAGTGTANFTMDINLRAPLGARPGVNMPVVVVPYQSVAYGSTITIAGITNFELIPNPELRKNLPTFYGKYSPDEMTYTQWIMANRDQMRIRSVWNSIEYQRMVPTFRALADCGQHKTIANSLGWSDILNFVKTKVVPFVGGGLKTIFPQSAGLVDAAQGLIANSASGRVTARAAGAADRINFRVPHRAQSTLRKPIQARIPMVDKMKLSNERAVMFPCVYTTDGDMDVGDGLYAAVLGNYSKYLSSSFPTALSINGKKVYGLQRDEGVQYPLVGDITMLPIDGVQAQKGIIQVLSGQPYVSGHSCDGALWVLSNADFEGLYPIVICGEIGLSGGRPILQNNPMYQYKMKYVHGLGLPMAANAVDADLNVVDLNVLKKPPLVKSFPFPHKLKYARACC